MERFAIPTPPVITEKSERPIVADPDLCADDDMPDTVPDPRVFHHEGFEIRKGLIIE